MEYIYIDSDTVKEILVTWTSAYFEYECIISSQI